MYRYYAYFLSRRVHGCLEGVSESRKDSLRGVLVPRHDSADRAGHRDGTIRLRQPTLPGKSLPMATIIFHSYSHSYIIVLPSYLALSYYYYYYLLSIFLLTHLSTSYIHTYIFLNTYLQFPTHFDKAI